MRERLRFIGICIAAAGMAYAQGRGPANWTTAGYDAQRTSWIKTDPKISAESLSKPGFQFLWKLKLNEPLTPMIVLDPYTGYRGHKSLGFVAGYGIDIDLGIVEWKSPGHASATFCSEGPKSAVTRPTTARPSVVYTISGDGMLRTLYVSNGAEAAPAINFLPPDVGVLGLIVVDNVVYAETRGCNAPPNGIWALDLDSKDVATWPSVYASGTKGPAFSLDGSLYWANGSRLVRMEPGSLKLKGLTAKLEQEFTSSPVVFQFGDKLLVAAATRDGGIQLFDGQKLTEAAKGDSAASALATWQDASGTRWILAAGTRAITAWKVVAQNGVPTLQRGWVSRDIVLPLPPIIVNGVVFAASSGNLTAILYALDGATGKELWNSGNSITSSGRFGGLSAGGSQIYLSASDGTLYAFGFPMEH
jgi:hypothetical protein